MTDPAYPKKRSFSKINLQAIQQGQFDEKFCLFPK